MTTQTVDIVGPDAVDVIAVGVDSIDVTVEGELVVDVIESGPAGPPGVDGAGAAFYTHTQAVASAVWVIDHGLGFAPAITCFEDVTGDVLVGDITHPSSVQSTVQFNIPTSGTARCS